MRRLVQLSCLFGEKLKGEMTVWFCAEPEQEVAVIYLVFTLSCGLNDKGVLLSYSPVPVRRIRAALTNVHQHKTFLLGRRNKSLIVGHKSSVT